MGAVFSIVSTTNLRLGMGMTHGRPFGVGPSCLERNKEYLQVGFLAQIVEVASPCLRRGGATGASGSGASTQLPNGVSGSSASSARPAEGVGEVDAEKVAGYHFCMSVMSRMVQPCLNYVFNH